MIGGGGRETQFLLLEITKDYPDYQRSPTKDYRGFQWDLTSIARDYHEIREELP